MGGWGRLATSLRLSLSLRFPHKAAHHGRRYVDRGCTARYAWLCHTRLADVHMHDTRARRRWRGQTVPTSRRAAPRQPTALAPPLPPLMPSSSTHAPSHYTGNAQKTAMARQKRQAELKKAGAGEWEEERRVDQRPGAALAAPDWRCPLSLNLLFPFSVHSQAPRRKPTRPPRPSSARFAGPPLYAPPPAPP